MDDDELKPLHYSVELGMDLMIDGLIDAATEEVPKVQRRDLWETLAKSENGELFDLYARAFEGMSDDDLNRFYVVFMPFALVLQRVFDARVPQSEAMN